MTGRRLYDHFCDAARANDPGWNRSGSALPHGAERPAAWSFLTPRDRNVWNDMARRVTPKPRKAG